MNRSPGLSLHVTLQMNMSFVKLCELSYEYVAHLAHQSENFVVITCHVGITSPLFLMPVCLHEPGFSPLG